MNEEEMINELEKAISKLNMFKLLQPVLFSSLKTQLLLQKVIEQQLEIKELLHTSDIDVLRPNVKTQLADILAENDVCAERLFYEVGQQALNM